MAVQERLQLNRLDKWSTREQLCLASAVSSSGDQNWMSVSRCLKLLCAANRPPEFFSQKSCAVQYGALLENVETPKRKKRVNEGGRPEGSPASVETPTDLILRRLTEERIQELKMEIRKEQEEYAQHCSEMKLLQSEELSEEQLLEMWQDIEKQQEQQRIEEMKLENQMREREQRKQELQRNWRHTGTVPTATVSTVLAKPILEPSASDMDVEETITTAKTPTVGNFTQTPSSQTATSPLLSSLLKSPTSSVAPAPPSTQAASSARTTAPTITTLLTSGSHPNPNQPAITLKCIPPNEAAQLLARPISGPPVDSLVATTSSAVNLPSPSQSAPTLSMLLEKNKATVSTTSSGGSSGAIIVSPCADDVKESKTSSLTASKMSAAHTTDFNSEEVPMDIEEDMAMATPDSSIAADSSAAVAAAESDAEPDPNEEQQLLEVFKNIGNIDELGIDVADVIDDEEVDFLKGVDEDPPNEAVAESMEFESKLEADTISTASQKLQTPTTTDAVIKNEPKKEDLTPMEEETKDETTATVAEVDKAKAPIKGETTEKGQSPECGKTETISSDDSNDNIPLASLENKDRCHNPDATQENSFLKEVVESAAKNEKTDASEEASVGSTKIKSEMDDTDRTDVGESDKDPTTHLTSTEELNANSKEKSPAGSESSDVIVIQTDDDDESNSEKQSQQQDGGVLTETNLTDDQPVAKSDQSKSDDVTELEEEEEDNSDGGVEAESKDTTPEDKGDESNIIPAADSSATRPRTSTISIADTDDSSTTDISVATTTTTTTTTTLRREDRLGGSASRQSAAQQHHQSRKSAQETAARQDSKTDEDSLCAATPARPPMLRKLRDRDRSESPMIDEDNTMTSEHFATNQRSRRRYSSTPVIDSVPDSPASSDRDDRETRSSKKSLLSIFNALQHSKNASILQRAFAEKHAKYEEICLRPMDLQAIKRSIESGATRTVYELQRDLMLVCQNAITIFRSSSTNYKAAVAFLQELQGIREFMSNPTVSEGGIKVEKEAKEIKSSSGGGSGAGPLNTSNSSRGGRTASRKSQRIS